MRFNNGFRNRQAQSSPAAVAPATSICAEIAVEELGLQILDAPITSLEDAAVKLEFALDEQLEIVHRQTASHRQRHGRASN